MVAWEHKPNNMIPSGDVGDLWKKINGECKDIDSKSKCEGWKKGGHCQHSWLKANCKKTCNHCTGIADIHLGM